MKSIKRFTFTFKPVPMFTENHSLKQVASLLPDKIGSTENTFQEKHNKEMTSLIEVPEFFVKAIPGRINVQRSTKKSRDIKSFG